jgi:hypothetical protein
MPEQFGLQQAVAEHAVTDGTLTLSESSKPIRMIAIKRTATGYSCA